MTMPEFLSHHVALSVRDLKASQAFYGFIGFSPVLYWRSNDDTLTIAHLRHTTGLILELFAYTSNTSSPAIKSAVGNDLTQVGMKHIAVRTDNLESARAALIEH